jgi:hypothetical protein
MTERDPTAMDPDELEEPQVDGRELAPFEEVGSDARLSSDVLVHIEYDTAAADRAWRERETADDDQ